MNNITNFIYRCCSTYSWPSQAEKPLSTALINSLATSPAKHELSALKPGLPLLRNTAFFTDYLRKLNFKHAFSSIGYGKNISNSYDKSLIELRSATQKDISQDQALMGKKIITAPLLLPGVVMLSKILDFKPNPSNLPLSKQLQADRVSIQKAPFSKWNLFEGYAHRTLLKLGSILNLFDPHRCGNMPFVVGTRYLNSRKVTVLRHAVPTIENGPYSVEIAGEYKAFLADCRAKGQKVLYCSLLNPSSPNEKRRIDKLQKLSHEYKDVFHLIRLPLDGILSKDNPSESLQDYRASIKKHLKSSLANQSSNKETFLFSPAVASNVEAVYEDILAFASRQIFETYGASVTGQELKESKQALLLLFSTLLKQSLVKSLNIDYYNNTCKDGIDRGAVHLVTDLLWDSFLTGRLKENSVALRALAAWPAFMAKTQPILKKRFVWLESFAKWIEKAEEQGRCKKISQECLTTLGLKISQGIDFDNRLITLTT